MIKCEEEGMNGLVIEGENRNIWEGEKKWIELKGWRVEWRDRTMLACAYMATQSETNFKFEKISMCPRGNSWWN